MNRVPVRALRAASSWGADLVASAVSSLDGVLGTYGEVDVGLPWASVTKLCTALAVLVAVEEGTVGLDDELGPPGSTVRHLLAHASGLGPDDRSRVLARPGTRRIYSNAGFELLGEHLADRSGMPFERYLASGVLEPLGMRRTTLNGTPAAGAAGPLRDLLALSAELLAPTLVSRTTFELATSVAFPGLGGVLPGFGRQEPCDWGLGFELKDGKSPHWTGTRNSARTFGHFGQAGAFLWVDPDAGLACAAACDRPFGPWAVAAWPAFSDAVLDEVLGPPG